jgi:hypothetical protein
LKSPARELFLMSREQRFRMFMHKECDKNSIAESKRRSREQIDDVANQIKLGR